MRQIPSTDSFTRRQLLHGAAGMAASFGIKSALSEETAESRVNEHLESIPRTLPHVSRYKELLTDDAHYGLVVIRQLHWDCNLTQDLLQRVAQSQREIYDLICTLLTGKWIHTVHQEGLMVKGDPRPNPEYDQHQTAYEQGFENVDRIVEFGAVAALECEGRLTVHGGERTETYDASGPAVWMRPGQQRDKLLFEDREDALLQIIALEREKIACTVFGASHDFENNVQQWNHAHPQEKFSLLILTTNAVNQFDQRQRPSKPHLPRQRAFIF